MESSEPAVTSTHKVEETQSVVRQISIIIVHNYVERTISVNVSEGILEEIKGKAKELFGLSCIRVEIDKKLITSADQIFKCTNPKITIAGIKNKCALSMCRNRVNSSSDLECKFCSKSFCIKHSIPEGHSCENISDCKDVAIKNNIRNLLHDRYKE
ncbi:hypothetical protein NEIRO03_0627 [Nematocida sp. AWRm78]|nr:hypothetical protein NEIRO03_0627 [Nematocida sp. AWRm78]